MVVAAGFGADPNKPPDDGVELVVFVLPNKPPEGAAGVFDDPKLPNNPPDVLVVGCAGLF